MKPVHEFDACATPLTGWTLIEASAGTGKTWNISGLYLRLLLEKKLEVREILVVTFTRAATDELRERIRNRIEKALALLEGREGTVKDPFVKTLTDKLIAKGHDPEELALTLRLAFRTFDQASIFTIHSFCQHALALSAFSAGQAFSVRTETDDSELVLEAVHDFWRRHLAGSGLSAAFSAWLEKRKITPEKLVTLFRRHQKKPLATVKWPDTEENGNQTQSVPLEKAFSEAAQCWASEKETVTALLNDAAANGCLNKGRYKLRAIDSASHAFDRFFATGDPLALIDNTDKTELMTVSKITDGTRKGKQVPCHVFFDLAEQLIVRCRETETGLEAAYYGLLKRFLRETTASLKEKKHERRVLAFTDMLINLYDALNDPGMPWLAEALRQQFPAALIDEFQDTDPLQYTLFSQIYRNPESTVFLVGDPKQAIYSFRNADLHTYFTAREKIAACYTLLENYRSTTALIDGCNSLFSLNRKSFIHSGLDFLPVRAGQHDLPPLNDTTGLAKQAGEKAICIWTLPDRSRGLLERAEAKTRSVGVMADEIARLITAGQKGELTIGTKPVGAGDVAVLVRSHHEAALVRRLLAERGIGSVSLSPGNVFHSREAQELECVLNALFTPGNPLFLMAALATEMLGADSRTVEALGSDEAAMTGWLERFAQYRDAWLKKGAGHALRWLIVREGVAARLLTLPDGERRMTNLAHLLELIHRQNPTGDAPDKLMQWFKSRRDTSQSAEEEELRLETDSNLVQVMTVHRSKGLEFPFVFCPLLWDTPTNRSSSAEEGLEYHAGHESVIDYRKLSNDERDILKQQITLERAAEGLRLIYVALTRAIYRCYLTAGCYFTRKEKLKTAQSQRSLLNWLVAGDGRRPEDWLLKTAGTDQAETDAFREKIEQAWQRLPERCGAISVAELPPVAFTTVTQTEMTVSSLRAASLDRRLTVAWRMNSFSGLMRNTIDDTETGDHDERVNWTAPSVTDGTGPFTLSPDDILLFPKGPYAGSCLHAVLENADFTERATWNKAVDTALSRFPQQPEENVPFSRDDYQAGLKKMALNMLENVTTTPLFNGLTLDTVGLKRRLTEWPFYLASSRLSPKRLNRLLKRLGYRIPELAFADTTAYLNGFVDLVFESDGLFYLLDWKSNYLGERREDYDAAGIDTAMTTHGYHLQYLLYTVALHRYLSCRVKNYDYDVHFGGVLYLFIRAVRPGWKNADGSPTGVFFHKPQKSAIEALDRLLKPRSFSRGDKAA